MSNEQVLQYQNLIYKIMKEFNGYPNKEDLLQVGMMGLLKAYKNFDQNYGVKFSTYAYHYIKGEMNKLTREDKAIKINKELSKIYLKIEKAKIILSQKLMKIPTNQELANYLNIPLNIIEEAIKSKDTIQSLEYVISKDGKDVTLEEIIPDKKIDLLEMLNLKEILKKLDNNELQLLKLSLISNLTQTEIANTLNMTQVQVSRKLTKVKEKIKVLSS